MQERARLRILNAPHASEWERFKNAPACMVRVERSLSPCDGCLSHCCHHDAHLSAFEATRMALTLAVPLESFVVPEPYKAADIGLAPYHAIRLDEGRVRLKLRRREDRSCVFLFKLGERGRCGAYALRPGICRLYPFELEEGDAHIHVGTLAYCPTQWLHDEDTEARIEGDLQRWREDLAADKKLVARWNRDARQDRSFAAFARFAVESLAPSFGVAPDELYPRPRRRLGQRGPG